MRALKRVIQGVVIFAVLATAVIGFAHTRSGRPLLKYLSFLGMGKSMGCPLGYDKAASPEARDAARLHFSEVHRGVLAANTRPALGFTLDVTTRADVTAWAKAHDVSCVPGKPADLACTSVPAAAIADGDLPVRDLWLTFDGSDHLISVIAIRKEPSADVISGAFAALKAGLSAQAGAPSLVAGDPAGPGLLNQATVEYRFRDYYALARATNMGDGVLLTEEFDSLVQ